jgi:hypothetical protein
MTADPRLRQSVDVQEIDPGEMLQRLLHRHISDDTSWRLLSAILKAFQPAKRKR